MSGWRAALRVARRETRRARGRSALVVAMIAVPVAALAFGAVVYDSFTLRPGERADRLMGAAQAAVTWPHAGPVAQLPDRMLSLPAGGAPAHAPAPSLARLLALLPPGSRAVTDEAGAASVRTAAGVGTLNTRMLDYTDPLARGILRPLSGRAPAGPDEVALTPAAQRRLGTDLGGTVRLAGGDRTLRVVGTVEDPTDLSASTLVLAPGAMAPQSVTWLVATPGPVTWAQVRRLNLAGVVAVSRYVLAHPPPANERYPTFGVDRGPGPAVFGLIGGLAMLEIVLLAGSAFAVTARRRRRDLALVAAAGGTPAQLRRIVLADGVVLGVIAAVLGIAVGVAVAAAGRPLIEVYLSHARSGAFRPYPAALAVLAVLAVAAGSLAALVPAWIAARQDVIAALGGRRGIVRSRRRWVLLGAGLAVAGAVTAGAGAVRVEAPLILTGLVAVELGLVICTPAIVGLVTRLGRFLPLAPRIALRDTSRNRSAAAPAIAAVMAAVIGSLAVAVVQTASDARARDDYRPLSRQGTVFVLPPPGEESSAAGTAGAMTAALRETMPVGQVHRIDTTSCDGTPCLVHPLEPAGRACPYLPSTLRHLPTPAEQRAARRDTRCDGVNTDHTYFGGAYGSDRGMSLVVDPAAVAALVDVPPGDAARVAAALRAGAVVVDDPGYLDHGQVRLAIRALHTESPQIVTAAGYAFPHRPRQPVTLMTSETARTLGLTGTVTAVMATTSRMPSTAEQDRLAARLPTGYHVSIERSPKPSNAALLILAVVAAVIALGAAAVATGLAAADGRTDLATLAAVGASPRLRRVLSLSQAGVIAGLGSLLGTVAGVGAATAVLAALNRGYAGAWPAPTPYPITMPWLNVGIALVAVPLVAMLGAGLLTRSRLPIERRL